jgi:transposase
MQKRHELTDEQWERIKPLLPPQKPSTGRPAIDHRRIINGILWILKTGAPWRDLPERYGSWRTVYSRFYRWSKSGVWERIFSALKAANRRRGRYGLGSSSSGHNRCSSPSARSRSKRGDPKTEALGRSRGGFGTKVHVRINANGNVISIILV